MNANIKPDFNLPSQIYIQKDLNEKIPDIVRSYGKRVVLISTSHDFQLFSTTIDNIISSLRANEINCIAYDDLPRFPSTEDIDNCVSFIKKTRCDLILGFGGPESINTAKAAALLGANFVFCQNLFDGEKAPNRPVNFLTIPAYPVFGLEIMPLFFLKEIHGETKRLFFSEELFPRATLIDPSYAQACDIDISIRSSIASLAIAAESVISKKNNELSNTFALKSIDFIFRNLLRCYREPENYNPRSFVSSASVMAGIAFSSSLLSVSLSIALAVSSYAEIDVQNAMNIVLPHIMEFNLTSSPGKYVQLSKVMGEDVREITVIEAAIKTIEAIRRLQLDLDIPMRLSNYDIPKSMFKNIANLAVQYPLLENTPREITTNEVETILIAAY